MPKTLLINPPFNISKDNYDSSISVGLLCLASYLNAKGYPVKIIDGARQKNYQGLLEKEIPNSDIIGFSVMTTQTANALIVAERIRKLNPKAVIVFGGLHPTLFPELTVKHRLVDIVVIGEGEETLFEIIQNYKETVQKIFGSADNLGFAEFLNKLNIVRGIAFQDVKGKIIQTEKRPLLKMTDLPLPDWDLELREILENIDIIPTHTSRGCPYRCAFCVNAITKNLWRARTAEKVLEDIRIIKSESYFQGKPLRFWDENFFVDKKRAEEIIDKMIEQNLTIPWETTVRADYISEDFIDDKFLEKLKKSGCYLLSFGAESGSDRILKKIEKGIAREQILNSARQCLKYDIIPQYSFMVGLPGETMKDIRLTLSLIDELIRLSPKVHPVRNFAAKILRKNNEQPAKQNKVSNGIQILGPQTFRPYPGGTLYEECVNAGWQAPKDLDAWAEIVKDELNFLSPKNFPWLQNPDLIESLEAYVRFGAHPIKNALSSTVKASKFLKLPFILLCKLRWKLKFFSLPFEYKLAKKFISRSKVYE